MSEKLRSFDFNRASEITSTEKRLYPWEDWFDGDIWKLTQGDDFNTHPLMMERIIRTRAVNRHAKVRLRHMSREGSKEPFGVIIIQRTDIPGPAEVKKAEAAERRKAKKAEAEKEAEALLTSKGIQPVNGKVPAKRVAKKVAKTPSKTPSKVPAKRRATAA